jgi:glycerol-3-phosphate acyltransferase PlsY
VFLGLAAILGHNFPVYLHFKGGKGVATSLGALLALDPVACAAAAAGFFLLLVLTRYVSLASIVGSLAFVVSHFVRVVDPWSRENRAMSLLSISLAILLVARHHKNVSRILSGTEPKVPLRLGRKQTANPDVDRPSGRVHPLLICGLVVASVIVTGAVWVVRLTSTPIEASAGPWSLRETDRELTGQQRSTRVVFADHGKALAVLCPRYNKVLLYRVSATLTLEPDVEIELQGRPVAIASLNDRIVVLERPPGDEKHLGPGWWEAFDMEGKPLSTRVTSGYYPDDLAVTPDGRLMLVLCSGQAEGDRSKPLPGLDVFRTTFDEAMPSPLGHVSLEPSDDADRLSVSAFGTRALITLSHAKTNVAIDLSDPSSPCVAGRTELAQADSPYVSLSPDGDWIVMPTTERSEFVAVEPPVSTTREGTVTPSGGCLAYIRPEESTLELAQAAPQFRLGQFPLKGPLNLGGTRPSGLAFSADRGLLAVATKPGTVHLIAVTARTGIRR